MRQVELRYSLQVALLLPVRFSSPVQRNVHRPLRRILAHSLPLQWPVALMEWHLQHHLRLHDYRRLRPLLWLHNFRLLQGWLRMFGSYWPAYHQPFVSTYVRPLI